MFMQLPKFTDKQVITQGLADHIVRRLFAFLQRFFQCATDILGQIDCNCFLHSQNLLSVDLCLKCNRNVGISL